MAGPLISIRNDQRVFIVGATGSGKTHLARKLLTGRPYVVVIDPKYTFSWRLGKEYDDVYESFADLRDHWRGPAPAIYRPTEEELEAFLDDFWRWAWQMKTILVYVDEVTEITPPSRPPRGLRKALKMGREHGLSVWVSSQRPSQIPVALMSEAEQYFVGKLRLEDDRKRMAEYSGCIEMRKPIPMRRFWYYDSHRDLLELIDANEIRLTAYKSS